jgi:hypothetical protein
VETNNKTNKLIDNLFNHYKTQLDHRYFIEGLIKLGITFSPMVCTGQDYNNEIGSNYTKMVVEVNKKVNDFRKQYYKDFNEDEDLNEN